MLAARFAPIWLCYNPYTGERILNVTRDNSGTFLCANTFSIEHLVVQGKRLKPSVTQQGYLITLPCCILARSNLRSISTSSARKRNTVLLAELEVKVGPLPSA